jgi:methylmalonyl-CoA/ethylmalonyl-CoA epimerase
MLNHVEHIGIAVKDLESAIKLYTTLLGVGPYKLEFIESEKVTTAFFKTGETKIELLAASDLDSPIAKYLEKRGEGLHHIAYDVKDIYQEMEYMQKSGFTLIHNKPKRGAENKWICFIHPKDTSGVLMELCQDIVEEKIL